MSLSCTGTPNDALLWKLSLRDVKKGSDFLLKVDSTHQPGVGSAPKGLNMLCVDCKVFCFFFVGSFIGDWVLVFGFSPVLYVHPQLIMLMLLMFWKEKGCCRLWAGSVFADTSNSLFCRRLQRLHSTNRISNQTPAASSIVLISQPIRWLGDFHRRQPSKKQTNNKTDAIVHQSAL